MPNGPLSVRVYIVLCLPTFPRDTKEVEAIDLTADDLHASPEPPTMRHWLEGKLAIMEHTVSVQSTLAQLREVQ